MTKMILPLIILLTASIAYSQLPNTLSGAEKVYGLARIWQEVNYNFVYLEKINRKQWDSTFKSMITEVQSTENDYQYYRDLQRFCAILHDGHTNVSFPWRLDLVILNSMFGKYRLSLANIEHKAVVVSTNLSAKDQIPIGSEVVNVNGLTTREYIARNVAPYISSSTGYVLEDLCVARLLQGPKGDHFDITLRTPEGTMKELALVHDWTDEQEVYPIPEAQELLIFKWCDNHIAYVALNSFMDPRIDTLFEKRLPELHNAKAIIIDLRKNEGGRSDIGENILQYLTYDTLLYGSKSVSRMHIPTYKAWGVWVKPGSAIKEELAEKSLLYFHDKAYYEFEYAPDTIRLAARRVVVPTVLLIGHSTGSAAEDFLILADKQKHMIKIGENSSGSTGQPYIFDLPGGGTARVCTKKDTYPDGREFVGYGVTPDIEVRPTLRDFIAQKDAALEKAIEYLSLHIK